MKLLIDCHCFNGSSAEGINTYIKGVYSVMPALAPDIEFYFASGLGDKLADIFGSAPNVNYIKLGSHGRIRRMLSEYPRVISRNRIDAAHFQYFSPPLKNCRTIITLHDILFRDFPEHFPLSYRISRNMVFRHSARRADVLATVSEYSRDRITHHFGIPHDRIIVTPNAVAPEFFSIDRNLARREVYSRGIRPFLLNVSRIEPRKNQLAVVRAFAELDLAHRGYDLVLVSRPTLPVPELEQYIESLPGDVSSRIHRMGGLPHKSLKLWYGAASLFVFPSLAEGFGIPPLEAAAAGTPTICHNGTAMAEFRMLGDNLADLSNQTTLNRLIKRNLTTPQSEKELKKIADQIRNQYNWQTAASALLDSLTTL